MTPEAKARAQIDQQLAQAGWLVQDLKQLNLGAAGGVAVREIVPVKKVRLAKFQPAVSGLDIQVQRPSDHRLCA